MFLMQKNALKYGNLHFPQYSFTIFSPFPLSIHSHTSFFLKMYIYTCYCSSYMLDNMDNFRFFSILLIWPICSKIMSRPWPHTKLPERIETLIPIIVENDLWDKPEIIDYQSPIISLRKYILVSSTFKKLLCNKIVSRPRRYFDLQYLSGYLVQPLVLFTIVSCVKWQ